ncbi:MAG: hypothetical protein ABR616_17000 [Dermatophilaceae bacterium]|nr:hypothetical protein [Intrasporangiaceae bacterium]
MSSRFEDQLREGLRETCTALPRSAEPYARVTTAIAADRRRRRTLATAAVALVLAGAVGIAGSLLGGAGESTLPAQTTITSTPTGSWGDTPMWPPGLASTPRGPLADDATLTAQIAASHPDGFFLYGADVGATRIAVVLTPQDSVANDGPGQVQILLGEAGSDTALTTAAYGEVWNGPPLLLSVETPEGWQVIVLDTPGESGVVISSPSLDPDGQLVAATQRIRLDPDGTAIAALPADLLPRLTLGADPFAPEAHHVAIMVPLGGEGPSLLSCDECTRDWYQTSGLDAFRREVAVETRTPESDVNARMASWTELPDGVLAEDLRGHAVVFVAELPSGAILRSIAVNANSLILNADGTIRLDQDGNPLLGGTIRSVDGLVAVQDPDQPRLVRWLGDDQRRPFIIAPNGARIAFSIDRPDSLEYPTAPVVQGVAVIDANLPGPNLTGYDIAVTRTDGTTKTYNGAEATTPLSITHRS